MWFIDSFARDRIYADGEIPAVIMEHYTDEGKKVPQLIEEYKTTKHEQQKWDQRSRLFNHLVGFLFKIMCVIAVLLMIVTLAVEASPTIGADVLDRAWGYSIAVAVFLFGGLVTVERCLGDMPCFSKHVDKFAAMLLFLERASEFPLQYLKNLSREELSEVAETILVSLADASLRLQDESLPLDHRDSRKKNLREEMGLAFDYLKLLGLIRAPEKGYAPFFEKAQELREVKVA